MADEPELERVEVVGAEAPAVGDEHVRGDLAEVAGADRRLADRVDEQLPELAARVMQRRLVGAVGRHHAGQDLEHGAREHARERVRLRGQRGGRRLRRQRPRIAVEPLVGGVAQAVGLGPVRADLTHRPAELLADPGDARGPPQLAAGLGQHGVAHARQLERDEQRADVAEGLVEAGDLDAHLVPELGADGVEHRVAELVAGDVRTLGRVARVAGDLLVVEDQAAVAAVLGVEADGLVERDVS